MPEHEVHPWFASTTGFTLTSHNGSSVKKEIREGTLEAFRKARRNGYRWMQIDGVPIKGDELISDHAILGRRFGFRRKTLAQVKKRLPDAALLRDILWDPELADVYWNIEVKSKHGLRRLLELLDELAQAGRDMRTIMISSPIRPSVLREVAARHPHVALAAPVIHGGFFGVRFFGRKRARVHGKPYDCQQCWYRFVKWSPDAKGDRPLRQVWTINKRTRLHRVAKKRPHMIVDSERLALPWSDPGARRVRVPERVMPNVAVLALGGGGWRGAFGGVGAVLYFAEMEKWSGIRQVVGISGGSFAVAALSAEPSGGPDDADPGPRMTKLFRDLERAGRRLADVGLLAVTAAVPIAALVGLAVIAWKSQALWLAVLVLGTLCASSFLIRSFITLRWKLILRGLFGQQKMRDDGGVVTQGRPARRYRIGATGLNDGNLYSYTSDPVHDRVRWEIDHDLATPLGHGRLSDAVLRATSLPGVGQFGLSKMYRCDGAAPHTHVDDCLVPDRLVDGGISGIFGRGLVEARDPAPDDDRQIVVVDAGRSLQVNSSRTFRDHLSNGAQRMSVAVLLSRWLMVAFDVGYRSELKRVADDEQSDGYRCLLVRLAEEERANRGVPERLITERRQEELNRLLMLRDRVHKFSLLKASRGWANRSVAVAVAACALDCEEEPDVEKVLESIGRRLISNGHQGQVGDLADVWNKIAALGQPVPVP